MSRKALDYDNINENVKKAQYAVRGELYLRASELQKEGKKIIFTNVGNPHALGQKPLTFPRQVVALCQAPFLLDDPNVGLIFPADAIAKAKLYLSYTSGGLGAYSDSRGLPGIRKEVADFIGRRDGYPSDPELIYLTDGASKGVMQILQTVIRGSGRDGIPVPQYPLYSAAISLFGGSLVPYYLEESANWGLDITNLRQSVAQARSQGISVRAMVIINPGNPTGQCLSVDNLQEILRFCHQESLVLLGDEVYQQNVYQDERPFVSSRKVLLDMGGPISRELELISFHTVSKGFLGECGQRGGYFEMTNIPPQTVDEIYKVASISLSPNMGCMVSPPKPGDISYEQFLRESKGIMESLRKRAHMMTDGFNSCKNVVCNFTEGKKHLLTELPSTNYIFPDYPFSDLFLMRNMESGAMYSFPQIKLPPKAIEAAKRAGKVPDVFYCLKLLEATGISTVPGSGFGQKEGVFHLRTTILPAEEDMPAIMDSFKKFNDSFMGQYEDQRGYSRMPIHPVIFTSPFLKTEELKVTPMPEIYKRLTHGVDVGTRFIVYGMVIGIDMDHDWKYIQCNKCFKKAKEEGNQYKLVITIQDDNEEMNCVLFNTDAILLLGHTVDELITKSIKEGAGDPDWIVDYFIDSLIAKWVVLGIKIDSYNLAPTYVRRYTVTKYYGEDLNALNKHFGSSSSSTMWMVYSDVNIPSSLNDFDMNDYFIDDNNMGSTTTDYEEKIMDELMWGQVCETKDSLQVEVQDVVARDIGVNTIVSSSFSAEDDIQTEIDTSDDVGVEDTNVEDNQVDETGVGEAVVSEPQPNDIDVDDA
ncbi:alanine-2-oxoglutarate aminotransferase 2 [Artemisia annua]|uniref:alanine transaminase n=2 Tax=Anthemideae TaxID=102810 RepID=A0A2U1M0H6_ARTAN|nr:alanine-2-oxoglutarate aminotransferase 2 [Artemisia annua]